MAVAFQPPLQGGNPLNILLLGKTGHGKSATGNTLLEKDVFLSEPGGTSVTVRCEVYRKTVGGRELTVVDTPGTMDTKDPETSIENLATAVFELNNNIDAIIIVLNYSTRMTEEEKNSIENLKLLLGSEVLDFVVVVFTHADNYVKAMKRKNDSRPFSQFLKDNGGEYLGQFLEDCGNRYALIDNFAEEGESRLQIIKVVNIIDEMMAQNSGKRYQNSFWYNLGTRKEHCTRTDENTSKDETVKKLVKDMTKTGAECFPAESLIMVTSVGYVKMKDLLIGDKVITLSRDLTPCTSEFYLFGHSLKQCKATFICLRTKTHQLKLTRGHYIHTYTNGHLKTKAAKEVAIGDILLTLNEGRCVPEKVTDIWQTEETGLYAPFTLSGSIVVDGVLASCYVDVLPPDVAHSLLWPVRQLYKMSPSTLTAISKTGSDGIPRWIRLCLDNFL